MEFKTQKRQALSLFCIVIISIHASWAQLNSAQAKKSYQQALDYKTTHEFTKSDSILASIHPEKYTDSKFRIQLWDVKANIKRNIYQTDSALYFCRLGLECAVSVHSIEDQIAFHTLLQQLYCRQGKLPLALDHIQQAVLLCSEASSPKALAPSLKRKAEVYILMGRTDLALTTLDRSLTAFKRLNDRQGEQIVLLRIGRLHMNVGEFKTSEKYMNAAIEIAFKEEDNRSLAYFFYRKTALYIQWNKFSLAQQSNEKAFLHSDSIKEPGVYGQLLLHKAILQMNEKAYQSADSFANRSYNMYAKNRQKRELAKIFLFRSQLNVKLEKPHLAAFWIDSAIIMTGSFHDPFIQLKIYHQKAMVSKLLHDEKSFLKYSALFANVKDSICGIENLRAVLNREMKASEIARRRKDSTIHGTLAREKEAKKSAIFASRTFQFLFVLILVIVLILIIRNQKKKKLQEKVKAKLNRQLNESKSQLDALIKTGTVPKEPIPAHFIPLSNREQDVFAQLILGKTDKEIAETLFISATTVRTHVRHIYEKLHINSRMEAKVLSEKHDLF